MFRVAAELPSLGGLLADGESPLWLVDPPADACTRMLALFRATDDAGNLVHDFTDPTWSTRFLGDLYQDLSQYAKDTYALLQTPDFVEEFILDRTLTPAIETFGLAATTLIDPTCGSGHFLLGAFGRLFDAWREAEPGIDARLHAQRALTQVAGVDLNPFAAAIARLRLLVAAMKASGLKRFADEPVDFVIDVAVGDSLLWGARPGQFAGMEAAATPDDRQFLYRTEHADILRRIFDRRYKAVVGNPPYISVGDPALNQQYRDRYGSCHREYSLGVPFTERFFHLATAPNNLGRQAGFVGMITTNSFMKREFGKKLIEQFIPHWDLTHVIDASGAYIPGHGTPTVILFGRHRSPVMPIVRAVMGIRGEPSSPTDPSKGLVWTAIVNQIDVPGSESAFVSVADADRERFCHHPWSIGGGGAAELKSRLDKAGGPDRQLQSIVASIGGGAVAGEDECFLKLGDVPRLKGSDHVVRLIVGDQIRDWINYRHPRAMMVDAAREPESVELEMLWPYRTTLQNRRRFGVTLLDLGEPWWPWREIYPDRAATDPLIGFVKVASQPHFVLRHNPSLVFKDSAPTVLLNSASLDDQLGLVGLLNSSVACFWMQQVFHNKGAGGGARVDAGYAARGDEGFLDVYEHDATKLRQFPLPLGPWPKEAALELDMRASAFAARQPTNVCGPAPTRARLDAAQAESSQLLAEMVSAQEELDWVCLQLYGVTDNALTLPVGETAPPLQLGERAFEIVLARKVAAGELKTAWFTKHRSTPLVELPSHWPDWYCDLVQRRIDLIERNRDVALVERPEHKRRWAREPWEKLEQAALQSWLAERLEDRRLWFEGTGEGERAVCRSVAQLADRIAAIDPEFFDVARLWKGAVEIDPVSVIADLVTDEHVPAQSVARYKGKGVDKRAVWERTWDLQRMEDRGEPFPDGLIRSPVPPKYAPVDFAKPSYWKQRGKLDVPKERFTSIVGAEREADPTLVLAWAGFDHAQLAQAIATLAFERQQTDGWDAGRLWPIVVGLIELLPWLAQWHGEVDPRLGDSPANQYRAMAEQLALAGGRTIDDAAKWSPPAPTRGRKKKGPT